MNTYEDQHLRAERVNASTYDAAEVVWEAPATTRRNAHHTITTQIVQRVLFVSCADRRLIGFSICEQST